MQMISLTPCPSAAAPPWGSEHTALQEAAGCSPHTPRACRPTSFLLQALALSYLLASVSLAAHWRQSGLLHRWALGSVPGVPASLAPRPSRACPQAPLRGRACPSRWGPSRGPRRAALGVHQALCLVLWQAHFRLMSQSSAVSYDSSAEPSGFGVEMKGEEGGIQSHQG